MNLADMIDLLNNDLANEYKHWHFYINAALRVQGLHNPSIKKLLLEEANSEMLHILEFGSLITGLGATPTTKVNAFRNDLTDARQILSYALAMEQEVVENYVLRKQQAAKLGGVAGERIGVFLDSQISASGDDVDKFKQMLAGV